MELQPSFSDGRKQKEHIGQSGRPGLGPKLERAHEPHEELGRQHRHALGVGLHLSPRACVHVNVAAVPP